MGNKDTTKQKKATFIKLKLNIDELSNIKLSELDTKMFGVWKTPDEVSQEYIKLQYTTGIIARYLASCCNEGPEVKDNLSKRMILTKSILHEFLAHVGINGWMLYGLLFEFQHDIYIDISGSQKVINRLKMIQEKQEQHVIDKSKEYVQ